jgi:hypothetical protein
MSSSLTFREAMRIEPRLSITELRPPRVDPESTGFLVNARLGAVGAMSLIR